MNVTQINLICADLQASRRFYEALDMEFRPIRIDGLGDAAFLSTSEGIILALHSPEFARWWDPSTPGPSAGSGVLDFAVPRENSVDEVIERLVGLGAVVVKDPEDMELGDRYAMVTDPDGHRIGLRQ